MTPERKEYLENIPPKEKVIRECIRCVKRQLAELQNNIEDCRWGRCYYGEIGDEERYLFLKEIKVRKMLYRKAIRAFTRTLPKKRLVGKINQLKPCPFCGGKAKVIEFGRRVFLAKCTVCDLKFPNAQTTREKCIEVWNRRAER